MKVLGITTQQEFYVGSKERNFRINEFLVVQDVQGDLIGEVVEAQTFNRYIPLNVYGDFIDASVIESMKALGYDVDEETIYVAKLRLLEEALYPVETGSDVRIPRFSEIKNLMLRTKIEDGLCLGVIRNTDTLYEECEEEYKDLLYTFEEQGLVKQKELPYIMDLKSMHHYPHIGVFGGSGSGKSFGLRVFLEELMQKGIPTIVLDPHFEMDFSDTPEYLKEEKKDFKGSFKCLQVGVHVGVKFEDLSAGDLKNLLDASSPLSDAMNNVVDVLFKNRDSYLSFSNRLQALTEAQEEGSIQRIQQKIDNAKNNDEKEAWEFRKELFTQYDKTCPYNSVKGILWRLRRLYNEGIFSKDSRDIENYLKDGLLVVIQGSTRILQVYSTYLLNNIYHKRREFKDAQYKKAEAEYFPPFIVVTDEAHNFAPKGYESPSKSILKEISQEGRKYGVFLALATQRPTLLDETITAQLNTKLIFRTVRASDIDTIKEETDITSEEAKRLPYLRTGDVFISSAVVGRTIFARIRAAYTISPHTQNPFDELKMKKDEDDEKLMRIVLDKLPIAEMDILDTIREIEKDEKVSFTIEEFTQKLENLYKKKLIGREETIFGYRYIKL